MAVTTSTVELPPGEQAILIEHGLHGQRRDVSLDEIDWGRSAKNQARFDSPLDQDRIDAMAEALSKNDTLPACIFASDCESRLLTVWSGNNRVAAFKKAGHSNVPGVVIATRDEMLWDIVPRRLNITGGRGLTHQDRVQHAMHCVETWKMDATQAAAKFLLKPEAVTRAIRSKEIGISLERLGISKSKLADTHLIKLSPIADNDHLLKSIAQIAIDGKLTTQQIGEITKVVNRERSESAKLCAAEKMRLQLIGKQHSPAHIPERRRHAGVSLKIALSTITKILSEVSSVRQLGITDKDEIADVTNQCEAAAKELRRVAAGKARR